MAANLPDITEKRNAATLLFVDRVVTLCSSMLVLSIAFRSSMLGPAATQVWLLKLAWVALATSTVCGVFLHLATASAAKRVILRLRVHYDDVSATAHPIYHFLYFLLLLSFPVGITALMLFGIINTQAPEVTVGSTPLAHPPAEGRKAGEVKSN